MHGRSNLRALLAAGAAAGLLATPTAAMAQTTPPGGACNGVLNQLQQRQEVEANLLRAAARQNAALITELKVERSGLVTERDRLNREIADAEADLERLALERTTASKELAAAKATLADLNTRKQEIEKRIAGIETTLDGLRK